MKSNNEWTPQSWQSKPIKQPVDYKDIQHLQRATEKLSSLPPLVDPGEISKLKRALADVALGKAFLLQGGDCAELFDYCTSDSISKKLKVLLQMSLVLVYGARVPVVRIARMAGQYAKPRSKPTEIVDGQEILSFRGDNVNGFPISEREPNPERLVSSYFHSAATLNYVRSLLNAGFADLHHSDHWDLGHIRDYNLRKEYQTIVSQITDSLDFMKTIGAESDLSSKALQTVDIFMSHEGLMLPYEQSLTRKLQDPESGDFKWFNCSAHFLWIGDRTRQLDGAHVEYFSGIENPIGIKVGPSTKPEDLIEILNKLNPKKEIGKITLITRFGYNQIETFLPPLIQAVKRSSHRCVWICDPMHGNTYTAEGLKTRNFSHIIQEISKAFKIHKECDNLLNGIHLELTGESVTECVGGFMELEADQLSTAYQTYCDPRLNYEQSLDIAFLIAKYYEKERRKTPWI